MNQEIQAERVATNIQLENLVKTNQTEENFGVNSNSFDFLNEFKPEGSTETEIPDNPK